MCLLKRFQLKLLHECSIHASEGISFLLIFQNLITCYLPKKSKFRISTGRWLLRIIFKQELRSWLKTLLKANSPLASVAMSSVLNVGKAIGTYLNIINIYQACGNLLKKKCTTLWVLIISTELFQSHLLTKEIYIYCPSLLGKSI